MQTAFFSTLLSLIDALKDEVGCLRFFDSDHLHGEVALCSLDHPWEGLLADLTLKLSKVVRNDHTRHLLLHLTVDPHLQALHVNALAGTLTFARGNEEVVRGTVIA